MGAIPGMRYFTKKRTIMRDDLMVQQQVENEWQHMVGVICLNQTGRKKVKKVLPGFFKKIRYVS